MRFVTQSPNLAELAGKFRQVPMRGSRVRHD